jgi:hypothetical protein
VKINNPHIVPTKEESSTNVEQHTHVLFLDHHFPPFQYHNAWNIFPKVDMNTFNGSNPYGWVMQMEHYLSLHGIPNDLMKLIVGVLYMDIEHW